MYCAGGDPWTTGHQQMIGCLRIRWVSRRDVFCRRQILFGLNMLAMDFIAGNQLATDLIAANLLSALLCEVV